MYLYLFIGSMNDEKAKQVHNGELSSSVSL